MGALDTYNSLRKLNMKTEICNVMRTAYERGWITTRDGNCSVGLFDCSLITPSGVEKQKLTHPSLVEMSEDFEAKGNVSGEFHMHKKLQIDRVSQRAVLHLHPTYCVAAMFAGWDLQALSKEFPEVYRYTKVGQNVPPLEATSKSLATHTNLNFRNNSNEIIFDVVGQENHGVTAIAESPLEALEHIERLEHICKIAVISGVKPNEFH